MWKEANLKLATIEFDYVNRTSVKKFGDIYDEDKVLSSTYRSDWVLIVEGQWSLNSMGSNSYWDLKSYSIDFAESPHFILNWSIEPVNQNQKMPLKLYFEISLWWPCLLCRSQYLNSIFELPESKSENLKIVEDKLRLISDFFSTK